MYSNVTQSNAIIKSIKQNTPLGTKPAPKVAYTTTAPLLSADDTLI